MAGNNIYLCLALVLVFNVIVMNPSPLHSTPTNTLASRILQYMNETVNPCDNFYKYICGNFLNTAAMPDGMTSLTDREMIVNKVEEQLTDIMKTPSPPNELKSLKFIKKFYNHCLDQNAIDQDGFTPVLQLIERLGSWPVLERDQWNDKMWTWSKFTTNSYKNGILESHFLDFSITANPKDSSKSILNINSPYADDVYYTQYIDRSEDEKYDAAVKEYMVDIVKLLIGDKIKEFDEKKIKEEVYEGLDFINVLMNISQPYGPDEIVYNPMTLKEMTTKWPSILWLDLFTNLFPTNSKFNDDYVVNVIQPEYLTEFDKILKKTSIRVQANFAISCVILDIGKLLPTQAMKKLSERYESLGLSDSSMERPQTCLRIVQSFYPISVNELYSRRYYDKDIKKSVIKIVTDIKNQLLNKLEEVEWMDENTRIRSLEKANFITSVFTADDNYFNDARLDNLHGNYEYNCDRYFDCYLNIFKNSVNNRVSELENPVRENPWIRKDGSISPVNLYYSLDANKIIISAQILQDILFKKNRPKYVNYGILGSIIGEEILKSFNDKGRLIDKNGNLNEMWSNFTKKEFNKKAECFIHQYDNYLVEEVGLKLSGASNLESNILFHGGIKLAYEAYNNRAILNEVEPPLPGFNSTFTPRKLFWMSLVNANCVRMEPDYIKKYIEIGHSIPPEFQINGALSDIPEFSQDFNCPSGSNMIHNNACTVW